MKKVLLSLSVIVFALAAQAGDSCCAAKSTAANTTKDSCCPAMQGKMESSKANTCRASKQQLTTSKDAPVKKQSSPKEMASR